MAIDCAGTVNITDFFQNPGIYITDQVVDGREIPGNQIPEHFEHGFRGSQIRKIRLNIDDLIQENDVIPRESIGTGGGKHFHGIPQVIQVRQIVCGHPDGAFIGGFIIQACPGSRSSLFKIVIEVGAT